MQQNDKATIAALKFATKLVFASLQDEQIPDSVLDKRRRYFHRLLWMLKSLGAQVTARGLMKRTD